MTTDLMCSYCLRPRSETGPLVASPLAAICASCARTAVELFEQRAAEAAPDNLDRIPTPWSQLSDQELLARLPQVAAAGTQVEQHLTTWVTAARQRGISWAKIGQTLGMTRQSAWERFRDGA
ncbi:MAG: ClpX C4-type zinc finger protein [Galactobacter sp.]